jgi:flagellar hook-associated protein 2
MSADSGVAKVTQPSSTSISTATSYTLTVGQLSGTITPASNSLNSLAAAINAKGANVVATVVNLGSTATPDYRLSLKGTKLGDVPIQLSANTVDAHGAPIHTSLMTQQTAGSLATYKPNGSATAVTSDSRDVTLSPGVTVTMQAQSTAGHATSVTVTRTSDALGNALQTFVNAYNAAEDDLNKQRGLNAGALSGQSVVFQLRDALNQLGNYFAPGGPIASLADMGVTFDQDASGKMSFDDGTFLANSFAHSQQMASFLGDGVTGGFLKAAGKAITQIDDPTAGSLASAINGVQAQITTNTSRISTEQLKIDQLQTQLMNQMAAADALISSMEQQYTVLSNIFEAMNPSSSSSSSTSNSLA